MKNFKGRALEDRILVEPQPTEDKTASGIIIPESAKEKPHSGIIVATGPGTKDIPMDVKVGEKILYGKFAGTEMSIDGEDYLLMRKSEILLVV